MIIDFESVMVLNGCEIKKKSGNYKCPFCGHYSFKVYTDGKAYCHTDSCNWSGNAITFHAKMNKISNKKAYNILVNELNVGNIQILKRSYAEALDDVAEKLVFMAKARMYFEFYRGIFDLKSEFADKNGFNRCTLTNALNGYVERQSPELFNKVYYVLKSKLNMEQFEKDFNDIEYQKKLIKLKEIEGKVRQFQHE